MPEVHDLDPRAFLEEVHSFEFWFQAVEGYLSGLTFGHKPGTSEEPMTPADRERLISVLCNYCVGETAALEASSGLIAIAPNRLAKVFLSTQVVDEGRHLEVLLHRMRDLGVADPEAEVEKRASPGIVTFKRRLLELVAGKDWESAIFAQNDRMAVGAIRALREVGQHVPEDVSVIGFDDMPLASYFDPPLTTMRQDLTFIGSEAVRLLIRRVEEPQFHYEKISPEAELVLRSTTARR